MSCRGRADAAHSPKVRVMKFRMGAVLAALLLAAGTQGSARVPFHFGQLSPGPLDGITDVPGVMVGHVTKVEGSSIRTGATAILPNADPWVNKVSAAAFAFNGNGEMTGTHWINEAGFLETPIVLTDTLDIGRADDGQITWMMQKHPEIGRSDTVPLPVNAECDDSLLNDITARAVSPGDVVRALDAARTGQFARGNVGAGTGMVAFGFKGGIGSASRVLPKNLRGYTVGVLVNDNTSSGSARKSLMIDGVHIGAHFSNTYKIHFGARNVALHGRMAEGSIIVIVATNAPLDSRQLRALSLRASLGMARTGLYSAVGSGDLFLAFSTGYQFERTATYDIKPPQGTIIEDEPTLNALYLAATEATEGAIYDALFSARTMTGRAGTTVYGLPAAQVLQILHSAGVR